MQHKLFFSTCALVLAAATVPANAAELIQNGDFENGLNGWSSYVTDTEHGTISPITPNSPGSPVTAQNAATSSFNVTGGGASNALWLNAGEFNPNPFYGQNYEGGGVSQTFTSAAGLATFSADIAFRASNSSDIGGIFSVLIDGVVLGSYDFGTVGGGTTRNALNFTTNLDAGTHTLQLQVVRPYAPAKNVRAQYFDNVSLDLAAVPEPATWAMMIAGFGLVGGTMRRQRKVAVSFA